jgi:hypothetical protein
MTDQEILRRAIARAANNGWHRGKAIAEDYDEIVKIVGFRSLWQDVIYSHDFAIAFWGEAKEDWQGIEYDPRNRILRAWHYHLQHMVIEDEPLKYIEQFLDKETL